METLVLDGTTFVKASRAARELGYTSDYVGQLCRSGKVSAHLVGRTWYVDQSQLGDHRVEKKRNARVKAREQVRKALEERKQLSIHAATSSADPKKRHISYEEDEADLMPVVKKISVTQDTGRTERKIKHYEPEVADHEPNYTVLNEGNKVVMSGTIVVTDAAEDAAADEDTVFLRARIEKKKKLSEKTKERSLESAVAEIAENLTVTEEEGGDDTEVAIHTQSDFLSKLQKHEVMPPSKTSDAEFGQTVPFVREQAVESQLVNEDTTLSKEVLIDMQTKSGGLFAVVLTIAVSLVIAYVPILLESEWTYSQSNKDINTTYIPNSIPAITFLKLKI